MKQQEKTQKNKSVTFLAHNAFLSIQGIDIKEKILVLLGLFGLTLALNLFIFSLPHIGSGLWPQSETASAMLHICAGLCAISLIGLSTSRKLTPLIFTRPAVLFPLSIGLISLTLTPLYDLPLRNLFGSTRTGEGAIWWLDLSLFTATGLILWRLKTPRAILKTSAIISLTICFALTFNHLQTGSIYSPYFFPDYLALNLVALLPITYSLLSKKIKSWPIWIILYVAMNTLLWNTENRAMIAYSLILAPAFLILLHAPIASNIIRHKAATALLAIMPITIIALLLAIPYLGSPEGFYDFSNSGIFRTFASRAFLMDVSLQPLITAPASILTGHGWGTFVEHIAHNLPLQWLDVTDYSGDQWDGLTTDHFHSHNMFLETLNATGLFAALLLVAYIIALYTHARKSRKTISLALSAGVMTWASFWFLMPLNMPFLALASTSTASARTLKPALNILRSHKAILPIILIIILGLQLTSAFIIQSNASQIWKYNPQSLSIDNPAAFQDKCPIEYSDHSAGGIHLAKLTLDRVRYLIYLAGEDATNNTDIKPEERDPEKIGKYIAEINHLFCQASHYVDTQKSSTRLEAARLMIRGELLIGLNAYLDGATKTYYYLDWDKNLMSWLKKHPTRSDQAVSYLLFHIITQQENRSQPIIDHIYKANPQDPVGLWFKGLSLLQTPQSTQQGLSMMRSALDKGIERFMPIEEELLNILKPKP